MLAQSRVRYHAARHQPKGVNEPTAAAGVGRLARAWCFGLVECLFYREDGGLAWGTPASTEIKETPYAARSKLVSGKRSLLGIHLVVRGACILNVPPPGPARRNRACMQIPPRVALRSMPRRLWQHALPNAHPRRAARISIAGAEATAIFAAATWTYDPARTRMRWEHASPRNRRLTLSPLQLRYARPPPPIKEMTGEHTLRGVMKTPGGIPGSGPPP
eukprot:gene5087-biopygen1072